MIEEEFQLSYDWVEDFEFRNMANVVLNEEGNSS